MIYNTGTYACVAEVKGAVGQIIAQDKLILAVEQNKTLIPPTYQRFLAWGFADQRYGMGCVL